MRIEKGYHGWGADIGTDYTLADAGLAGFADLSKPFIGRDAMGASEWEFVGLEIQTPGPEVLPSDPILSGGEVVGYVTSATLGYRTGKHLALGYIQRGRVALGEACAVRAFGETRAAIRHAPRVYDPENLRLKV